MVVAWTLTSNPSDNYLECNGQSVDATKYPKLYKLMQNVPDYRGVFLRGFGSVKYSQINGSLNGITETIYTSGELNEIQGDGIRNITGKFVADNDQLGRIFSGTLNEKPQGAFNVQKDSVIHWDWLSNEDHVYPAGYLEFSAANVVPTTQENRPINKAIKYFIKAK